MIKEEEKKNETEEQKQAGQSVAFFVVEKEKSE